VDGSGGSGTRRWANSGPPLAGLLLSTAIIEAAELRDKVVAFLCQDTTI
jgi:hypothetical protein